jgi:enoyl-CoA hydratase/carnithine racemase
MQTSNFTDISYELDSDGIVTVSMDTPKRKNAISGLTALELCWAARHFQENDNALAMILTGTPDPDSEPNRQAFSSGGYFVPGVYDDVPEELFFYPETLTAQHLLDLGLANAVLPHDELLHYTRDKALQLVPPRGAGASIRAMKRIVNAQKLEELTRALDLENEVLNELMKGEDFMEGLVARVEKREPVFKGR